MTEITFIKDNNQYKLELKGHSGDVRACAAVSMIIYLMTIAIDKEKHKLKLYDTREDAGNVCIKITAYDTTRIDYIFDIFLIGFKALQSEYPKNITYTEYI